MIKEGLIIFAIIVLICVGCYMFEKKACSEKYMSFEYKFSFYAGCMIYYEAKWIPVERFRILEE